MYKKDTISWLKHWDFILWDLMLMQAAFFLSNVLRNGLGNPYENTTYRNVSIIIGLLDVCTAFFMESYKGILRRGYWLEFKAVVKHVLVVVLGTITYLFVMKQSDHYSRIAMFYFPVVAVVLLYLGRCLWKHYLRNHIGPASGKRAIMLIAGEENYEELIENFMMNLYSEFKVVGVGVVDGSGKVKGSYNGIEILKDLKNIIEFLQTSWVDEVMFSLPDGEKFPGELLRKCGEMGLTVHLELAKVCDENATRVVEKIEGYTVISSSITMASPQQLFLKRCIDICGGIVGVIGTGFLFVIVAPIIYIKSPGPIFFSQWRVGKNGRKFKIYKFRSMYMDAEERKKELMAKNNIKDGLMFKMDDDPRIIKGIGHFIRDYSLDEFPQFWNVLKGDMSLVGTRPPTLDEWEKYDLHHRKRLAIKPGVTGMWQVSGRSNITDFEEVVRLDTKYIQKWTIGLDIKILLRTVLVVLGKDGSM